ncbi:HEXXH motif domain-containing protein [Actinocorallia longicatena]|uniref:HEXXH motif domain-containing protein n=1 Tax=Actinocorallia longicatena TaxID=111803 RepID=A0ABP6Q1S6_9ACTN
MPEPTRHRIPPGVFAALSHGGGGAEAVRLLAAAQYSKTLLLLRALDADRGGVLASAHRRSPEAVDAVLRHPAVGARLLHVMRRGDRQALAPVGAAAALRAGLRAEVETAVTGSALSLPSLGRASLPGATRAVVSAADRTITPDTGPAVRIGGPGWTPLRTLDVPGLTVSVEDLDPFRFPGDLPLAARLSPADHGRWRRRFADAWTLLAREHPAAAAETAAGLRSVVPLETGSGVQVAATSGESFGALALSLPGDPLTFALTFVHETQHLKLCALIDLLPLIDADDGALYHAPWRPDPRPLSGLLQGAYAFLAVTGFWARHLAAVPEAAHQFARWRLAVARTLEVITGSGSLTGHGLRFVDGMRFSLAPLLAVPVARAVEGRAVEELDAHREAVSGRTGGSSGGE